MKALLWEWGSLGLWGRAVRGFSADRHGGIPAWAPAHPEPHFLPLEYSAHLVGYFKDSLRFVWKVLSTGESTLHTGAVLLILVIIDMVGLVLGAQGREAGLKAEPPGVSLRLQTWQA